MHLASQLAEAGVILLMFGGACIFIEGWPGGLRYPERSAEPCCDARRYDCLVAWPGSSGALCSSVMMAVASTVVLIRVSRTTTRLHRPQGTPWMAHRRGHLHGHFPVILPVLAGAGGFEERAGIATPGWAMPAGGVWSRLSLRSDPGCSVDSGPCREGCDHGTVHAGTVPWCFDRVARRVFCSASTRSCVSCRDDGGGSRP